MADSGDVMTRITIIDGHPDPNGTRYVHALADAYAAGGEAAGHEVRRIEIAELDFPILRSAGEWRDNAPAAAIHKAQTDIRWRSEEHTSELQSLIRTSYAVFC